ncbi:hypothetical protein ACFE04_024435 [Oxalis oulophora]
MGLDRETRVTHQGNHLMRILNVAAFVVSGYASTEGRQCKPFNPLLGETYEADYPDKGLRFFSEKVSHHPMVVVCHCEGRGWKFWGDSNLKGKFWGRSIQLDPVGVLSLQFDNGETFQWSKVTTSIYNIILGKIYCDHYGTMRIKGSGRYSCKLKFKEQSIIDRNPHQWDEAMYYVLGDPTSKPKGYDPMTEAMLLWERDKSVPKTRYNFTPFAISLNELTPGLSERLPPTDSRLRPDQGHLENGEYELANAEKHRLEHLQRQENVSCGCKSDVADQQGLLHNKETTYTNENKKHVYQLGNGPIFRRSYYPQYLELVPGDPSRNIIEMIFHRGTENPSNTSKKIKKILKVKSSVEILERFEKYRDGVKKKAYEQHKSHPRSMVDGNELMRFYGTTMACCGLKSKRISELCKDPFCRVCRLIQSNFNTEYTKKHGIDLSTSSMDINDYMDYTKFKKMTRAAIVCRIIAGWTNTKANGTHEHCDSIRSQGRGSQFLNIRSPSAILPCFVIVFA